MYNYRAFVPSLLKNAPYEFVPFGAEDAFVYDGLAAIPEGRDRLIALVSRDTDAPLIKVAGAIARIGTGTIVA